MKFFYKVFYNKVVLFMWKLIRRKVEWEILRLLYYISDKLTMILKKEQYHGLLPYFCTATASGTKALDINLLQAKMYQLFWQRLVRVGT